MIPAIRPSSNTGSAPMRFSPSLCTASSTVALPAIVSTALPLPRSTDAMVMGHLPDSPFVALILPLWAAKGKSVPQQDPLPSRRQSTMQRFWRIFRLLVLLALVIATIGVILVSRGDPTLQIHMMIATGAGIFLTVLVGTGLMTL